VSSPGDRPFAFRRDGENLVDAAHGLRIRKYCGPEYTFKVCVEPCEGPQAEAWPIWNRAYSEFAFYNTPEGPPGNFTIDMALAHQPFDRGFPVRSEELLDTIIPLIIPTSFDSAPGEGSSLWPIVPPRIRQLLRENGKYFRHVDEPGTDAWRKAHPWQVNPQPASGWLTRLATGLVRVLRKPFG